MSGAALTMMILFMVFLWGGLIIAAINLKNHNDEESGDLGTGPGTDDESLLVRATRSEH
ncbi:MAG: methionine/alanine import NSS transporter subunit MetS [Mycobacteriaceae bacterium]|uniref:methionine/alanine import NSS transporter subunit MetS n=1 Tax=Corynebacterium sp. TaxID=1720 RepID=UPI003F9A1E2C